MFSLAVAAKQFAEDESGATAIEYGMIAALIALGIILALTTLGNGVQGLFVHVQNTAGNSMDAAG